jgi:hypothetical protein
MAKLEISLFGPFQVLSNRLLITPLNSIKVRFRLAYLVFNAIHSQPRKHLVTLVSLD